jgi:hypothetical protein
MLGAILGGLGAVYGAHQDAKNAKLNAAVTRETNAMSLAESEKNRAAQKEFAQSGIQWRAADAKAAGIHPIFAMGANVPTYTPSSATFATPAPKTRSVDYGAMGQDIGRAITSTMDGSKRVAAISAKLSLENQKLNNDLLRSQIAASNVATLTHAGSSPGVPSTSSRMLIDGQSGSGRVRTSPMSRQASAPGSPHQEAGAVSDYGFTRTKDGWAPVMSKDAKDRLEEDFIGTMAWNLRNRILPSLLPQVYGNPPDHNKSLRFNPVKQQYDKGKKFLGLPLY